MRGDLKNLRVDFPGGSVAKSPPSSVGDIGSVLGWGRLHVLWSS